MSKQVTKLLVENYTPKSIVVRGEDSKERKEDLKAIGGKWNSKLSTGPGWIFPVTKKEIVTKYIQTGCLDGRAKYQNENGPNDTRRIIELEQRVSKLEKYIENLRHESSKNTDASVVSEKKEHKRLLKKKN